MGVYLYQLSDEPKPLLSLSIGIDISYWKEQGKFVRSVYQVPSINLAVQQLKNKQICFRPSIGALPQLDWQRYKPLSKHIFESLAGRAQLYDEIQSFMNHQAHITEWSTDDLLAALQVLQLQKQVSIQSGVELGRFLLFARCHRCFATSTQLSYQQCATCGIKCVMCNHCYLLGKSSACTPFFCFATQQDLAKRSITLRLPHQLTAGQQQVIKQVNEFFSSQKRQFLLWAVTGSGKTECMIYAIKTYLEQGKCVLWVTPRKDVVLELAPRLQQLFPDERVLALYGGSPDRFAKGSIVVATAHQAYRYYQSFALGIVDEVDAFPLYQNQMLEAGIQRALTADAKQIFLTATPPVKWKQYVRAGKLTSAMLPVRYHRYPLPVPVVKLERNMWNRLKVGTKQATLYAFVNQVVTTNGQAMLFVPRVKDLFIIQAWLFKTFSVPDDQVAIVYAKDPQREEKIQLFRQGKIRFLGSTTILERGVTVARSHVAVVGAEHLIFDRATLVQIAGRVGRSGEYQLGEVWFIAQEKTSEQIKAIREIEKMNTLAEQEGFLRDDSLY